MRWERASGDTNLKDRLRPHSSCGGCPKAPERIAKPKQRSRMDFRYSVCRRPYIGPSSWRIISTRVLISVAVMLLVPIGGNWSAIRRRRIPPCRLVNRYSESWKFTPSSRRFIESTLLAIITLRGPIRTVCGFKTPSSWAIHMPPIWRSAERSVFFIKSFNDLASGKAKVIWPLPYTEFGSLRRRGTEQGNSW